MVSIGGAAQWLLIRQVCAKKGGEEQSLLIRDWQPIPSSYSQTDSQRILMSCALCAFVNTELHAARKHNNTSALQEYREGIEPMPLPGAYTV